MRDLVFDKPLVSRHFGSILVPAEALQLTLSDIFMRIMVVGEGRREVIKLLANFELSLRLVGFLTLSFDDIFTRWYDSKGSVWRWQRRLDLELCLFIYCINRVRSVFTHWLSELIIN